MTHSTNIQRKAGASISVSSDAITTSIDTSVAGPSSAVIINSDAKNDSSSDNTFAVPAENRVRRQQAFREAWLKEPELKLWFERVEDNPYKGRCRVYSKCITGNKADLNNHANSRTHCMNMIHQKEALTSTGKERTFAKQVNLAEMRVCMDAVEQNISFQSYCDFIAMLQKALPNPDILPHMSLKKKKMRAIVKNAINKSIIDEPNESESEISDNLNSTQASK